MTDKKSRISKNLQKLGYDEWFHEQCPKFVSDEFSIARIIEVNKANYKVADGLHEMIAEISGKMLFGIESGLEYPTVGDWVVVQCFDSYSLAIIHQILPRKTVLKRRDPGKAIEYQLIAANIDYAFIVQAVDGNYNMNRLERYLVMVNESKIIPVIVLSKTDLISARRLEEIQDRIESLHHKYLILPISTKTGEGMNILRNELLTGRTYCLLGSSGVGKSTLLNKLLGEDVLKVREVREKNGKGKHATSRRQLVSLESGGIFIDTPGMRELGNIVVDTGISETYNEISLLGEHCRFKDCTHTHEKGCKVIAAVKQGEIEEDQYKNFLKIQKESEFYAMSYVDKRKKDKAFGKMVKNIKKTMRKK